MSGETINIQDFLTDDRTIGRVERFGTNNTRSVYVRTDKLLEWAAIVHAKNGEKWTEVAVTPNYPIAAYPENDSENGIALAPGLYPEDYEQITGESE